MRGLELASLIAFIFAVFGLIGGFLLESIALGAFSAGFFAIIGFALSGVDGALQSAEEKLTHIRGLLKIVAAKDMPPGKDREFIAAIGNAEAMAAAKRGKPRKST